MKLKPCPFCGGTDIDPERTICERDGKNAFQATCGSCQATGPAEFTVRGSAIGWNRRVVVAKAAK